MSYCTGKWCILIKKTFGSKDDIHKKKTNSYDIFCHLTQIPVIFMACQMPKIHKNNIIIDKCKISPSHMSVISPVDLKSKSDLHVYTCIVVWPTCKTQRRYLDDCFYLLGQRTKIYLNILISKCPT